MLPLLPSLGACCLLVAAISSGQQFVGYDSSTHLFFANHYQQSWWHTWEPRWYGGFDVLSYPPLLHQLLALAGWALGLSRALKLTSLALIAGWPVACFVFARELVGKRAAYAAATLSLLFPAFSLILVSDGQLPGLFSLELLLGGLAAASQYIRHGRRSSFWIAVAATAAAAAAHHATPLLAGPFLGLAVAGHALIATAGDRRSRAALLARVLAIMAAAAGLTLWPFALWWSSQPAQTAIDHFSRHNFILDESARFLGLWLPYSIWLAALPLLLLGAWRRVSLAPAAVAGIALFILSLGGTTPLPAWLYGSHWQWLTYERYALWTAPLLLAFSGRFVVRLAKMPAAGRILAALPLASLLMVSVGFAAWYDHLSPFEPNRVDLQPAAAFLDAHGGAYLTLGLGDQLARLSTLTEVPSIDGDYNSGRTDPLLTHSGVEKLDSIRFWDPDAKVLRIILGEAQARGLRWVLSNDGFYDPILLSAGWRRFDILSDGLVVWAPPQAVQPLVSYPPRGLLHRVEEVWWGVAPLASLAALVVLLAWAPARRFMSTFPLAYAAARCGFRPHAPMMIGEKAAKPGSSNRRSISSTSASLSRPGPTSWPRKWASDSLNQRAPGEPASMTQTRPSLPTSRSPWARSRSGSRRPK